MVEGADCMEARTEQKRNESNGGGYVVVGNSTAFYKI